MKRCSTYRRLAQSATTTGAESPINGRLVAIDTAVLPVSFRVEAIPGAAMPASASLLALAGIVGFALVSMLLGVFS